MRCKLIREIDPNHDVYVGPVGLWMPWEPDAFKTGKVEYVEKELNNLMKQKIENENNLKKAFDKRVTDAKQNAIKENIVLAKKNKNKLTQTVNDKGELIGIKGTNTIADSLFNGNEIIDTSEIKKELFEGENIRTKSMKSAAEEYQNRSSQ